MSKNIVGILLAAGQSTRFGDNKLLHSLPGTDKTVAVQSAQNLTEVLPNCVAVVSENTLLKSSLAETGIQLLENSQSVSGISSSIVLGIQHTLGADGWVIALADMPYIPPSIFEQVVKALRQGEGIVAPTYNNQRGHPIGFSKYFKDALLNLKGDVGARKVIQNNLAHLYTFESLSGSILHDIDMPEDLRT